MIDRQYIICKKTSLIQFVLIQFVLNVPNSVCVNLVISRFLSNISMSI